MKRRPGNNSRDNGLQQRQRRLRGFGPWRVAACLLMALGSTLAGKAHAADRCEGMRLDGGRVVLASPIPTATPLIGADLECAKAIAAALVKRPKLRSVTLAARVLQADRSLGTVAEREWRRVLESVGIPALRITTIVPTVTHAAQATLEIAYREPTARQVAMVQDVTGKVLRGASLDSLQLVGRGSPLAQGEVVASGPQSRVRLALADGSFLAMAPNAALKLGAIELNASLKRSVSIELLQGRVEAVVVPQSGGAFEIATGVALAGVRGTSFRVALASRGRTVVETVEGLVELQGRQGKLGTVLVHAGETAWVDASGVPSQVRKLLPGAQALGPLQGKVRQGAVLRWTAVPGATRYVVALATDGEHSLGLREVETAKPEVALPADLAPGTTFWRVFAIDDDETIGLPSKTYRLQVEAP